jgi:cytochrome c biogenesis protein CcmG, thiol:disulfide interchange protein DsbE
MRLNTILLMVAILVGAGLTFWLDGSQSPTTQSVSPQITTEKMSGEEFPQFSFVDLQGKKYNSEDYKGKIIVLNFWATWCAPCIVEFPKLIKLAKDNPDIVLIALSSDINDDKINQFLKKNPVTEKNFIVARDNKRKITTDIFKTYKLPETIIVAPSGLIVKKVLGDIDWNSDDIKLMLDNLRKGS